MKLINQLRAELSMSVILVTHDLGVIAQMCDRVAVMYAGIIVEMTDTITLFDRPRHPYTIALMNSLPDQNRVGEKLETIEGAPPNLANPPPGCPFAPRCHFAEALCTQVRPELTEVESEHLARCHFLKKTLHARGITTTTEGGIAQ